jgi:hypothetical protein
MCDINQELPRLVIQLCIGSVSDILFLNRGTFNDSLYAKEFDRF